MHASRTVWHRRRCVQPHARGFYEGAGRVRPRSVPSNRASGFRVFVNGDIRYGEKKRATVLRLRARTEVMIGRRESGAPWIFRAVNVHPKRELRRRRLVRDDLLDIILAHLDSLVLFVRRGEVESGSSAKSRLGLRSLDEAGASSPGSDGGESTAAQSRTRLSIDEGERGCGGATNGFLFLGGSHNDARRGTRARKAIAPSQRRDCRCAHAERALKRLLHKPERSAATSYDWCCARSRSAV